ncbi:MAG: LysR substrate-binding domain-containing protein [Gordonia paraffinivorans]
MRPDRMLDGRLKIRHLVVLTTLADEGSMVRAAAALGSSQPAITRALREAETVVGAPLFHRRPRGMTPTDVGRIFLDGARTAMGALRSAADGIDEFDRVGARPVRVGTNLAGAYSLLPRALIALKRTHPAVSVSVTEGSPDELAVLLARDEIDMVVGRLDHGMHPDSTHSIHLYDEPVRLLVRAGHPATALPDPRIADLVDHPWILPQRSTRLRDEIDEVFHREGVALPRDVIECSTIVTSRPILLETDAVAPLPVLIGVHDDQLAALSTPLATVPRSIGVTVPADRPASESARALFDIVLEMGRDIARHDALARY